MRIDLMLCDFAQVHAGKLYVTGAAVNLLTAGGRQGPHAVSLHLAALLTVPWAATDGTFRVRVALEDARGERVTLAGPPPGETLTPAERGAILLDIALGRPDTLQPGEDSLVPFAVPVSVRLPMFGTYTLSVAVGDETIGRLAFRLAAPPQD